MRPKILVAESAGFSPEAVEVLRRAGDVTLADLDRDGLLGAVGETDALCVRLRNRIDGEVMDAAPLLTVIASLSTGLNHVDLEEAERRGIRVVSLKGESDFLKDIRATAELTVGLVLTLARHLPGAVEHALEGGWNRDLFKGHELYGKTAGIVGYGRLGRIVARYLRAFDMRVLTADPYVEPSSVEEGVRLVALPELLAEADLVSLHVSYSGETHDMIGRREFEAMREGAWFVNTARGELVDESALLEALKSGRLAAAALDVLCEERSTGMGQHPLVAYAREHDNLIITPHIGGCTQESMEKTEIFLAEKLRAVLSSPPEAHG
ncbi:MAG: hydroxyacid dehydrogenase [Chloroflexia bacterium]